MPVVEARSRRLQAPIEGLSVSAFTVPTDEPESDGTAEWSSTTVVVVEARGGGLSGLGYTYAPAAAGKLVEELLVEVVCGRDAFAVAEAWEAMAVALRNAGRAGIGFCALSTVDLALWDLKARLLDLPLAELLGRARDVAPRLRQRRVHLVLARADPRSARRVGRAGRATRKDEGLARALERR